MPQRVNANNKPSIFRLVLAAVLMLGAGPAAVAQHTVSPILPAQTGYAVAPVSSHVGAETVRWEGVADPGRASREDELAQRVADLEEALRSVRSPAAEPNPGVWISSWTVRPRGRVFADHAMFGQNAPSVAALGNAQDTTFFRTGRLGFEGTGYDVYYFTAEVDFASRSGNGNAFKDMLVGVRELPLLGAVQVGHFKEPFSIEVLTSSRFITCIERSLASTFVPGRNMGLMARRVAESEDATFAIGVFRELPETPPFIENDDYGAALTMRGTWLPWYDEATEGRGLLHLGLGYSYRDSVGGTEQVRARAETGAGPHIVDTTPITGAQNYHLLGPELAFVYGPFSVQTEYIGGFYNRAGAPDAYLWGSYVQMSYFVTGESRNYSRSTGAFGRVRPFENFFHVRGQDGRIVTGKGAWELTYRYSYLDLQDATAAVSGGRASNQTFGVNWYLTPYTRVMLNYIHSNLTTNVGADTFLDVFAVRAQFDF